MPKIEKGQTWFNRAGQKILILGISTDKYIEYPVYGVPIEQAPDLASVGEPLDYVVSESELESILYMTENDPIEEWDDSFLVTYTKDGVYYQDDENVEDLVRRADEPPKKQKKQKPVALDNLYG